MFVIHKNGEKCDGHVTFEETYEQGYRIVDRNGKPLNAYGAFGGKRIPNIINDGYIETTFVFHEKSYSTVGSSYAGDDDKVIWNKKD